jgi:cytochrome c553
MPNLVGLVILIAIAALLAWSGIRLWRAKNNFLKWGGTGLAALLAAAVSIVGVLTIAGLFKLQARSAPVPDLKVAGTPEQIQRGQAIADSFCGACHSKTGTLTGGEDVGKHFPVPVGSLVSANLTPAGRLSRWSDGELFRAIRNSVDADGRWLIVMSYTNAGKLSDDDIHALITYIRSRPAAGQQTGNPPDALNLLGVVMLGAGMLPTGEPVMTGVITAPPKGPTLQYGEYIMSVSGLPQMPRRRFGRRRAGSAWADRARPASCKGMDARGIHRNHAHGHRSRRPRNEQTNAVAPDWKHG